MALGTHWKYFKYLFHANICMYTYVYSCIVISFVFFSFFFVLLKSVQVYYCANNNNGAPLIKKFVSQIIMTALGVCFGKVGRKIGILIGWHHNTTHTHTHTNIEIKTEFDNSRIKVHKFYRVYSHNNAPISSSCNLQLATGWIFVESAIKIKKIKVKSHLASACIHVSMCMHIHRIIGREITKGRHVINFLGYKGSTTRILLLHWTEVCTYIFVVLVYIAKEKIEKCY